MDSLKRWLKRLFDDLQFIVGYRPGDPVPRSASLYKSYDIMQQLHYWKRAHELLKTSPDPSAPTNSSGSSTSDSGSGDVRYTSRDSRHDNGGGFGFAAICAAAC